MNERPKVSHIFLSTRESETVQNYDTFWSLNLAYEGMTAFRLSLAKVCIPNTVYPINAYNQKIFFDEGAGTLTATLTSSNYTGTQFAAEIQTQLNAAGVDTYTVVYSLQTKKLTITSTGTFTFVVGALSAFENMGYSELNFATAASAVSDFPINIAGTQYVDIVSNVSTQNYSGSTTASVFLRVPMLSGFGSIIYYEPEVEEWVKTYSDNMNELYMQLRDDHGNMWMLPDNSHVSMTLKMEPIF